MSDPQVPPNDPSSPTRIAGRSGRFEDVGDPRGDDATVILSYLITGPAVFGGLGWGIDRWAGTSFVVAIGLLLGIAMSFYLIWLRYGGS